MNHCIKTLAVLNLLPPATRRIAPRKSRGRRRRERANRFAAWLMDVQDAFSDTAR